MAEVESFRKQFLSQYSPKIKIVKLVSGEQFVGEVGIGDGCILVYKPTVMGLTQEGLQARPWLMFNHVDEIIHIKNEFVMCIVEPENEVAKIYDSSILNPSDIIQPPKTKLELP